MATQSTRNREKKTHREAQDTRQVDTKSSEEQDLHNEDEEIAAGQHEQLLGQVYEF